MLVTGPTGSGKTTTLAAMIDHINRNRECHIVTIEDPIEVLHRDKHGVDQPAGDRLRHRQLRQRHAGRHAPGPRRDPRRRDARPGDGGRRPAARPRPVTSCSRRSTRSTPPRRSTASSTSSRPTSSTRSGWPSPASLKGTICQRLVPTADGTGRVPALEVMVVNGRIQQCIIDPPRRRHARDHRRRRVLRHADVRPVAGQALRGGARSTCGAPWPRPPTPTTSRSCSSSGASSATDTGRRRPVPASAWRRAPNRSHDQGNTSRACWSSCVLGHTRSRNHVAWVTSDLTRGGSE